MVGADAREATSPRPGASTEPLAAAKPPGHPFAPTEFPKGWSATEPRLARVGDARPGTCIPREEDSSRLSRPGADTSFG